MAADSQIICVTTDRVEGLNINQTLGLVWGISVINGRGDSPYQHESADAARQAAYDHLRQQAQSMGANAVLGIAMDSFVAANGDSWADPVDREYTIYGTAVILGSDADYVRT